VVSSSKVEEHDLASAPKKGEIAYNR
jgi:hypothetical protein